MKRHFILKQAFVVILVLGLAAQALAAEKRITAEIVASIKLVTEVNLSQDGKLVAYTLRSPREEGEEPGGYRYQIWLTDNEGKNPRPLTSSQYEARSIQWFADSRMIAFLSQRGQGAKQQVYTIRVDGGEAQALTSEKDGVETFRISPDERTIAFTRKDTETVEERENKKKGRDWQVVDKNLKFTRLYLYDVKSGKTQLATEEDLHVTGYEWAPSNQELIFTACETPLTDHTYMYQSIYKVSTGDGKVSVAVPTEGKLGQVSFSPSGRMISWLGAIHLHDPSPQSLFVANADGNGKKNLTPDYEGSVSWFEWIDDRTIAMVGMEKTSTHLYMVNVETGQKTRARSSRPLFTQLSFDQTKKSFAFAGSSPTHPTEVFYVGSGTADPKRLTRSNPKLEELQLSDQFTIEYKAQDGVIITGVVMRPVGYQQGQRYPLIVSVHGGPESAVLDGWNTNYSSWGQVLAAQGYVVFWPNYRGSTARGVTFSMMDQRDLGGQEFRDVLAGIDYLANEMGLVDKSRVGMGGGSYGGYFSALAATRYSEHFKAAVNFAGISNWLSFTGTSDIPMENSLVHWGFTQPANHMAEMWDGSPMKYIHDRKTPLLLVHGEKDLRVPIGQAWELYTWLKIIDSAPLEFIIYPREGHGLVEREHQIHYMDRVLDWFSMHVKGVNPE